MLMAMQVCQEKPIYSGLVFLEGRIETTSPSHPWACDAVGHGSAVVLGPSRTIAIQRQGNGSYRVYLELEADEAFARGVVSSHDDEALRSLMLSDEHFGAWAPEYKTMIGHLGFGGWRTWPLYYLPPASVSWKTVPGVALAGDAAHLAMPNGEGVNCGMEDALRLAEGISRHGMDGLEDAVREYEGEMMPRGREHIEDGIRLNGAMLHRDNPGVFIDLFRGMMQGQ